MSGRTRASEGVVTETGTTGGSGRGKGLNQPLAGIRVVDTADVRGELAGRLLADLGAEVIRVEPPQGSVSRTLPPMVGDHSLHFAYRNSNKLGVTLDLGDPGARERFEELLATADVWIESEMPGRQADRGLDFEHVSARCPGLVVCSVTPFGQTGPYAGYVATDTVLAATSGMAFKAGLPDREPLVPPANLTDDAASITAAFAILCAHWQAMSTGFGQHLDFSINEATAQIADWSLSNASVYKHRDDGYPNEVRAGAGLYPVFKTRTGYVRLIILSPRSWRAMRAWLGEPDFLQDPELDNFIGRFGIADAVLNPLYAELFADMDHREAAAEAQSRGIVCTPVLTPSQVLDNDHFVTRGTFTDVDVAPGLTAPHPSGFVSFDGVRQGVRTPAPNLGQHNDDVFDWSEALSPAPAPTGPRPEPALPLAGLRIMDFGHGGVGVECGRMLAEYGADVMKIESREYFDFIRTVLGGEMSPSFSSSSRSKRGLGVNAKTPEGREFLLELAKRADGIIENNSTGTMESLGLDYPAFQAANPGIVMMSSQLLGSHGTYSQWKGYGPNTQPVSGLLHLWSYADTEDPAGNQSIFPDHLAGRVCALAMLAGFIGRERSDDGVGANVEAAQIETAIGVLGDHFMHEGLEPGAVAPMGNRSRRGAPWGLYPTAGDDQWVAICVRHDDDWTGLIRACGNPEPWLDNPALATAEGRFAHHDEIDELLALWTSSLDKAEVTRLCQAEGVPAGPMLTAWGQLHDPHFEARGFNRDIDQQDLGPITLEGPAFAASGMAPIFLEQAPRLGENTKEIAEELGYTEEQITELTKAGVLEFPL